MKTREEIEREYENKRADKANAYIADLAALRDERDAALAELDDPMARLIAAGRRAMKSHNGAGECRCGQCIEILNAIDYAEQRRAQG